MRYYFVLIATLFLANISNAQIDVNFNVGSQPVWGPTGYDYVEYYYLPDIETYYYVPEHRYYYYNNGMWIHSTNLPSSYSHYDYYKSYKVVINEREPWHNHKKYKSKYASYKGRYDQKLIRDSRDSKYYVIEKHPEHNNWVKQQENNKKSKQDKHDNGKNKK
jgi:hypothetical protein